MKVFVVSRSALLAGIAALVSAACSGDKGTSDIVSPQIAVVNAISAATAGVMQVCLDPASPAGNYHFTLTGPTNLQAGDVVAASPMAINNPGGPLCGNALTRTGDPNAAVASIGVTASTALVGTFMFACVDDFGGTSCNPASGVNDARAGESSFHGSTITFLFVQHVGPAAPPPPPHAPPPPPPPPPHAPPPPPPPPPPPIHPAAPPPPPPSTSAVFVVGDLTNHNVGSSVYFWGSQWLANNSVSGGVSNGAASFKGFATSADASCGGTWTAKTGNSGSPPQSLPSRITVIVTSSVNKSGSTISGDIVQILSVDQDGGYGPDPGKPGKGIVASINCGVGSTNH